jgi:hypothetical protein
MRNISTAPLATNLSGAEWSKWNYTTAPPTLLERGGAVEQSTSIAPDEVEQIRPLPTLLIWSGPSGGRVKECGTYMITMFCANTAGSRTNPCVQLAAKSPPQSPRPNERNPSTFDRRSTARNHQKERKWQRLGELRPNAGHSADQRPALEVTGGIEKT